MAGKTSDSPKRRPNGKDDRVLGRSAVSGRYVMKPSAKGASVSIGRVRAAVKSASSKKQG